ncbi:MAG: F0F1 ATP synthase subunit alpha [Omnitrophica bacterium RIFCSPHIGHO2_02_FULL_51_18]|nr:MAG: F0F1 ATP synthase subunit alpha [Omnitrophica bacterium RIFCSPHIGHO2_02_FULL_51_18]
MQSTQNKPGPRIAGIEVREVGRVSSIKQFIAVATGLNSAINGQVVEFEKGMRGFVMGFTEDKVHVLVLGSPKGIRSGDEIYNRGESFLLPAGERFLGRVVNALCEPQDGLGAIEPDAVLQVFQDAPGVLDREQLTQSMETGTFAVDAGIPIAKGQRQLFIGDRGTGKTTLAIDAILNQKDKNVICIYCCVGKPYSSLLKLLGLLHERGAMPYTIVVSAVASTSPGEQYIAPYSASMLGEYFMRSGRDVLVVFDDLTKHAWVYRQISLLLERPPGREAYPGDIFYIHSQLLERAGRLTAELKGGTMTFLPIVEILQGDVTSYIPTNLISITDGQIYFNTGLFNKGVKPPIDFGLSVSRIGNKGQWPAMRDVSKSLRLEYLQYQELLQMTQLRSGGISKESEGKLKRGEALSQLLSQPKNKPISVAEQIFSLVALSKGALDGLPPAQIKKFRFEILDFIKGMNPKILEEIESTKKLTEANREKIIACLKKYFETAIT